MTLPVISPQAMQHYQLGEIYLTTKQFEKAIASYQQALRGKPDWAEAYYALGFTFQNLYQLEEALASYYEALRLHLDSAEIYYNVGFTLHCLGKFDEALINYHQALRLQPQMVTAYLGIGCVLTFQNKLEEAESYFHQSARLTAENSLQLGKMIYFSQPFYQTISGSKFALPTVEEKYRHIDNFTHVVMVACDLKYFYKYGLNYLNSFSHNADKNELLHLHLVNPDPGFEQQLADWLNLIKIDNFRLTTEQIHFGNLPLLMQQTYYSCVRFLHLPQWLNEYQKPIVCTDIDAIIEKPLTPLIAAVNNHDVGLYFYERHKLPWQYIPAGFVVAHPTPGATRFFNLVKNYILHFTHQAEMNWHLDQIAIFCVLKLLERFDKPPSIKTINEAVAGLLWQIGNLHDEKLQDERFTRYSLKNAKTVI